MQGAIDLHVHALPDLHPRLFDEIELAIEARARGMAALLSKSHYTVNADRLRYVNKIVSGIECFGGVALNPSVGGLNPEAVKTCIKFGGKAVWMPSIFSAAHLKFLATHQYGSYAAMAKAVKPVLGITVLDERGELKPEAIEILNLIAEADIILATSHCSAEEIEVLVDEAIRVGVKKIVITHPNGNVPNLPAETQVELARKGAYLEHCFIYLMPMWLNTTIDELIDIINKAGPEKCVLATDMGQIHNPSPPEGLRLFIRALLERGVKRQDIETMVKKNPATLLNFAEGFRTRP